MRESNTKANQRREEEKEGAQAVIPSWSELCPDLLRCIFKRLSFPNINQAKSVCSLWYSASRGCAPKQNQIPWLILFPREEEGNNNNNNDKSSCVLFVPEDKERVYKTRDLGIEFSQSHCLATYGSWLLMCNPLRDLYIINPLTGERIDLPETKSLIPGESLKHINACFWIDNRTKDYLVLWRRPDCTVFTKEGASKWHDFPLLGWHQESCYNHKNQKLYVYHYNNSIKIWDFSGDKPREDGFLDCGCLNEYSIFRNWEKVLVGIRKLLAVTISGDVLMVACGRLQPYRTWCFRIFKANQVNRQWVEIKYLGDEALILDMGITVLAKDIPGIKRNSIYFSGFGNGRDDKRNIFINDLTTKTIERLPQCVFSSIQNFSHAQWFFPSFNG